MFLDNLTYLIEINGLNKNTFSKESGIPYKTIDNFWKKGCDNVKLSTLKKIAGFFNVSLDFLIFGDTAKIITEQACINLSNDENNLITGYRKLNETGKAKVNEYVEDLTCNEKYTFEEYSAKESHGA